MDDRVTRHLIGMQAMLIAAGAEMSRMSDAVAFTDLAQQMNKWRVDITQMVGEVEKRIQARQRSLT